jgi:CelD/BcsL family acetyltransferase involved in cellulose biosynthesis
MSKPQMARQILEVRLVESNTEFEALSEEWNQLLGRSASNNIFLTWEWLYSWWQHFGKNRQLAIRLVFDCEKLVGIAPLFYESSRVRGLIPIRFLQWLGMGDVGSDYLNIIAEPGYEVQVCDLIYLELQKEKKDWDLLRLTDLPEGCSTILRFQELLSANENFMFRDGREYICPYIELKNHSQESYMESLSSNMRYNLKRRSRQVLQQLRGEITRCESIEHVSFYLDRILELHSKRWKERGGSDGFTGDEIRAFHHTVTRRLFEKGWLRLYLLEIDGSQVAGIYGIEYGDTFSFYQSGFDPAWDRYSVGMILMWHSIKDALSNRISIYDFLHGTEDYKFKWTQRVRRTKSILAYPKNRLAPKVYFWLRRLKQRFETNSIPQPSAIGNGPEAVVGAEG